MTCRHADTGRLCPYADTCVSHYECRYGWHTSPCPPKPPHPPHPPHPPKPPKPQPQPYDDKLDEIIGLLKQTAKGTERIDTILQMLADVSFDVKGIKQQTSGKAIDESILDAEEMETLGKIAKKICGYSTPNLTAEQLAKLVYIANIMKK